MQIMDMDTMVPEHLVKNEDNSYTIFLNARLSKENQLKSYYNENDFCKENVQKIEYEAHND